MGAPPSAATAELRRQLRRVRWGRNLLAAQIALFGTIATLAAVAVVLVLLALRATPAVFAGGLVASALALVAALVLVGRQARRTWVRRRDAARWVDATAGLDGRLTTLLALDDRPALLLPMLRAQNDERRARWTPERLIPSPFPPGALGAAAVAGLALLAVLLAVPSLRPPLPQLVDGRGTGVTPISGLEDLVERLLASGGESAPDGGKPSADTDGLAGSGGSETAETLAHLPAALQASIRRSLWGERFATSAASGQQHAGRTGERHASRARMATSGGNPAGRDAITDVRPVDEADAATPPSGTGDAATGAGTGSDPNLLGAEIDDATADGHFALGLAARVLGRRAGLERPSGKAPPRDGDQHPALAARQRPAEPFHATSVPSAYAPIVRSLFTRVPSQGGNP